MDSSLTSGKYYSHKYYRGIERFVGKIYYHRLICRQKEARILVILHLYYMEAWPEICEYLKNLSPYNYSLVVTCMEGHFNEETLTSIKLFRPNSKIIKCDNIGWDVLPFLIALKTINLSDYDIVFKLQSKGTKRNGIFLYGQYFRKRLWFLNLFEGCLGAFTVHINIRNLLNKQNNIGLIAAKNLIVEDPLHKKHMVEETLKELSLPVPETYKFVSGTCFAIKANLLNPILDLNLNSNSFISKGFSFAHRMERIICFTPLWEGMEMDGPNVMRLQRALWRLYPNTRLWKKYNGVRILKDPEVCIDDQFAFESIEPSLITKWKFEDISLGNIRRRYRPGGELIPLSETLPFKYIVSRDPSIYNEYCIYNRKVWGNELMSRERFDALINSLEKNGDTHEKNIVIVDNDIIWDGQHRCCWLLKKYGPNFKIKVLHCYRIFPKHPRILQFLIDIYRYFRHV